jgi:hypothetical protein
VSDAPYIIVGRLEDCDVVLSDATVSGRHARLAWKRDRIVVEDLGSANGTFVRGHRIERMEVRPGDPVRFGRAALPWSDRRIRDFLRQGASGDTVVGVSLPGRRFVCGACGGRGVMPEGFAGGELRCGLCRTRLQVGPPKRRRGPAWIAAASLLLVAVGGAFWWVSSRGPLQRAAAQLGLPAEQQGAGSPQEASIRAHVVPKVVRAVDVTHPRTRNTAAQIAATNAGPYKVEQVARLWTYVRERWRYVNDPQGNEYFARASETIENQFTGDCDDFGILMMSMITAIGGEARLVMMDGPRGGHAYAEACVHQSPDTVRRRLSKHYRRVRRVESIHYRPAKDCAVWLNLDWNAGVPGGPYEPESWAVAIYPDGRTETLAPARRPDEKQNRDQERVRASSPPR